MLRILKSAKFISNLMEVFQFPAFTRLAKILAVVIYFVHLFACLWFFVANFVRDELTEGVSEEPKSWAEGENLFEKPIMFQYLVSIYWAF